jgi:lysozyme
VKRRGRTSVLRRHVIAIPIALVVMLGALAAVGWFGYLPEYRPALKPGETYGVDISAHQRRIDWVRVAGDHVTFAYIKATEGADFVDARFGANWSGADSAGVRRGAYHFFTLCASGAKQAANFLRTVPRDASALPSALDLELSGNCHERPPTAEVAANLATYLGRVRAATKQQPLLYVGDDFADRYGSALPDDDQLWVRRLFRRPSNPHWRIWQVSSFAHVHGIKGHVDLDVAR